MLRHVVATVLFAGGIVFFGCSAAQTAASVDAQWDGACLAKRTFETCAPDTECVRGQTFTAKQIALRVRLANERLERLGMDCDGWKP